MVKPLGNVKFVCKQCGWSKSVHLKSDVVFGEPEECSKCGCKKFRFEKDKSLTNWLGGLLK